MRRRNGFTLIEIMVAMVSALVLSLAIYSWHTHQRRQYLQERNASELQANARFVLEAIGRDVMLAGFRPQNLPGISDGAAGALAVEYTDERAALSPPYDNHRRVRLFLDGSNALVRRVWRWNPTNPAADKYDTFQDTVLGELLVDAAGAPRLAFTYYNDANAAIAPGTNAALLAGVRAIRAEFTMRSFERDPFTKQYATVTLSGTWRPRNLGIASNPTDNTPPAIPTGLVSWDPGLCGELRVRWTANTEDDLAGYLLFIGQEPGSYSDMVKIGSPVTTTYAFHGLVTTKSTDATPARYYFAMSAYDRSQNNSRLSTEVSGNPSPNLRAYTPGSSDSTVNVDKPAPPTGFDVAAGAAERQLDLAWGPSADATVRGWRLFRSTDPNFTPSGLRAGEGTCIADETTLTMASSPAVTSFTDPGLTGCLSYHYRLAAISCDDSLVAGYTAADYPAAYGDGGEAGADAPVAGVSNSTPTDVTPVSAPQITAIPGWQRTFMSLTNPDPAAEPDFSRTEVLFSTAGYPTVSPSFGNPRCQVSGGTLVPDRSGVFPSGGSTGNDFVHDSELVETPGTPELQRDADYYYLAVAYDRCGNCSPVTDDSRTLAVLCGDDPAGLPDFGGGGPLVTAQGCATTLDLGWTEGALKSVFDFAGYQVYRSEDPAGTANPAFQEAGATQLTESRWPNSYRDTAVAPGRFYSYAVRYMDCAYANGNGGNVSGFFPVNGLALGEVLRDSGRRVLVGDLAKTPITPENFEHGRVAFTLRNTSAGPMQIQSLALQWQKPTAFLQKIVIGDGATTSRQTFYNTTPAPQDGLTAAIDAAATTVPVAATSGFSLSRDITIGFEHLLCTGSSPTEFTGCTRGYGGTSPTGHAAGTRVIQSGSHAHLAADTGAAATVVPLFSASGIALPGVVTIDSEDISCASASANSLTGCERGYNSSSAAAHLAGATVTQYGSFSGTAAIPIGKVIEPLDDRIPVELYFAGEDGRVTARSDMRRDRITVDLAVENRTTGSTGCDRSEVIEVPSGPQIERTAQNFPGPATPAWPVPGDAGTNTRDQVIVPGGVPVEITTHIADTSGGGLGSVLLYYLVDASRTLPRAPDWNGSNYVVAPMTQVGGSSSDLWKAAIPLSGDPLPDDASVWYFIVALDADGNFDREPEVGAGAFQYWEQRADFCANTPEPPALSGTASSSGVDLTWAPPVRNTDGSILVDLDGFDVYRRRDSGPWTHAQRLAGGVATWGDALCHVGFFDYTYYLTASDRCSPTPNESLPSNCYGECEGAPADGVLAAAPCGFLEAWKGSGPLGSSEFGVALSACAKRCNGVSDEVVWVQTCAAGTGDAEALRLLEAGDSGVFAIDPIYYQGRSLVRVALSDPAAPAALDLRALATDTITIRGWSDDPAYPAVWDTGCDPSPPHPGASLTLPVRPPASGNPNPCATPPTPAAPTGLRAKSCSGCAERAPTVLLSWDPAGSCPVAHDLYRCVEVELSGGTVLNAGCDPLATAPVRVGAPPYTDTPALPLTTVRWSYRAALKAVNAACSSNVRTSAPTGVVVESCR